MASNGNNTGLIVQIKNGCKYYDDAVIFKNLNLIIPKGVIYGLLGPSGCGKTTLLNCIIGRSQLSSGDIWVLGGRPNTRFSGAPGPRVGFMPQDVALSERCTIKDILFFYGRICQMAEGKLEPRFKFLSELLRLPPGDRLVKDCSQGQQRRVSLAVTIFHEPEFLIVDEPTVGLDPEVRDIVWRHFVDLCRVQGVTILLTTHYIEEAKDADYVGFMREKTIIHQGPPLQLLNAFGAETLEDVFLHLIHSKNLDDANQNYKKLEETGNTLSKYQFNMEPAVSYKNTYRNFNFKRLYALLRKHTQFLFKNYLVIVFFNLLTISWITASTCIVGRDPNSMDIGIINHETFLKPCNYSQITSRVNYFSENYTWEVENLSCDYLELFHKDYFNMEYYNDVDKASAHLEGGKIIAYLEFSRNFSKYFEIRLNDMESLTEEDIDLNSIHVTMDKAYWFANLFKLKVYDKYKQLINGISQKWGPIDGSVNTPINITGIYGNIFDPYTKYTHVGFTTVLVHVMGLLLTAVIIFDDRADGTWYRNLSCGLGYAEILLGHFIVQFFMLIPLVIDAILIDIYIVQSKLEGDVFTLFLVLLVIGILGMLVGLTISSSVTKYLAGTSLLMLYFAITLFLSGAIWPIESFAKPLKYISIYLTPLAIPTESVRAIYEKGYSLMDFDVYVTLVIIMPAWACVFSILSFCILRITT